MSRKSGIRGAVRTLFEINNLKMDFDADAWHATDGVSLAISAGKGGCGKTVTALSKLPKRVAKWKFRRCARLHLITGPPVISLE